VKKGFALQGAYLALILTVMYIPVLLVIVYSFNESKLNSVFSGLTLHW